MSEHIEVLSQWWETAEEGDARPGDTIITPGSTHYLIETAPDYPLDRANQPYRILARAPKPKPAWRDAVAVIAHTDYCERQVWERESDGTYSGSAGVVADAYELRNVTPLIEAKVTDEMVRRGLGEAEEHGYIERAFGEVDGIDQNAFRAILTAALGLEIA